MNFVIRLMSIQGVTVYPTDAHGISEQLRKIGLEWKTADYLLNQQVVITIQQVPDHSKGQRAIAKLGEIAKLVDDE